METNNKSAVCSDVDTLCMRFDMNTIQHLGVKLYSKLPPVIGELVANSYDADASEVEIEMDDRGSNKSIIISDNGNGMNFEELNQKFLTIGRNKRTSGDGETPNGRKVIGKKGIGKLSIFGIADNITITTVKDGIKNQFKMSLPEILSSEKEYHPEQMIKNEKCDEKNGTIVKLSDFKRKSGFDPNKIAEDLAKRFLIFDEDFKTMIFYNAQRDTPVVVSPDLRFKDIEKEFEWNMPEDAPDFDYEHKSEIKGKIFTAKKPVPPSMKGIYLVARGKLVHKNSFYGISANDYAHAYLTGYLNVDFIDMDDEDLISTNRESLNWEHDETEKLQKYLQKVITHITLGWRTKRRKVKEEKVREKGVDVSTWINELPAQDKKLAKKMTDMVMNNDSIDTDKSAELISYVQESFEFGSFKEFAAELENANNISETDFIRFFKDWNLIEAREMYKLATVRIRAIEQFSKQIKNNAKEVPELHNFLKSFPWLLDPRIMKFEDEVRYSDLLREKFNDDVPEIPESDRRIDFLCIDLADTIFIIELKRPKTKANDKYLDQALEYSSFLREHKGNDPEFSDRTIKTYLICDGIVNVPKVRDKADSYMKTGKVYTRTYLELLQAAENYHREFIRKYEELKKIKQ